MQFLTTLLPLLFSGLTLALPSPATETFGGGYYRGCTCAANGYRDDQTGFLACRDLSYYYPNADWDGSECYDRDGVGVDAETFGDECARAGRVGVYYTSLCFD